MGQRKRRTLDAAMGQRKRRTLDAARENGTAHAGRGKGEQNGTAHAGRGKGEQNGTAHAGRGDGTTETAHAQRGDGTTETAHAGRGEGKGAHAGRGEGTTETAHAQRGDGTTETAHAGRGDGTTETAHAGRGKGEQNGNGARWTRRWDNGNGARWTRRWDNGNGARWTRQGRTERKRRTLDAARERGRTLDAARERGRTLDAAKGQRKRRTLNAAKENRAHAGRGEDAHGGTEASTCHTTSEPMSEPEEQVIAVAHLWELVCGGKELEEGSLTDEELKAYQTAMDAFSEGMVAWRSEQQEKALDRRIVAARNRRDALRARLQRLRRMGGWYDIIYSCDPRTLTLLRKRRIIVRTQRSRMTICACAGDSIVTTVSFIPLSTMQVRRTMQRNILDGAYLATAGKTDDHDRLAEQIVQLGGKWAGRFDPAMTWLKAVVVAEGHQLETRETRVVGEKWLRDRARENRYIDYEQENNLDMGPSSAHSSSMPKSMAWEEDELAENGPSPPSSLLRVDGVFWGTSLVFAGKADTLKRRELAINAGARIVESEADADFIIVLLISSSLDRRYTLLPNVRTQIWLRECIASGDVLPEGDSATYRPPRSMLEQKLGTRTFLVPGIGYERKLGLAYLAGLEVVQELRSAEWLIYTNSTHDSGWLETARKLSKHAVAEIELERWIRGGGSRKLLQHTRFSHI
ncbi:hypothetical protein MKEN_00668700 [Mycena kentingensis (nom. inval.)]|nr:hypothetical protein MKEN_00668700 [Mycena kentingensis (nom. inval.)]